MTSTTTIDSARRVDGQTAEEFVPTPRTIRTAADLETHGYPWKPCFHLIQFPIVPFFCCPPHVHLNRRSGLRKHPHHPRWRGRGPNPSLPCALESGRHVWEPSRVRQAPSRRSRPREVPGGPGDGSRRVGVGWFWKPFGVLLWGLRWKSKQHGEETKIEDSKGGLWVCTMPPGLRYCAHLSLLLSCSIYQFFRPPGTGMHCIHDILPVSLQLVRMSSTWVDQGKKCDCGFCATRTAETSDQ